MNERVTLLQAKRLRRLGYNQPCSTYHCASGNQIRIDKPMNWNAEKRQFWYDNSNEHQCTSIPKCDDVIDWLRKKYNIHVNFHTNVLRTPNSNKGNYFIAAFDLNAECKHIPSKRTCYKDIFAAKRDIIAKCLTYIESLSK